MDGACGWTRGVENMRNKGEVVLIVPVWKARGKWSCELKWEC